MGTGWRRAFCTTIPKDQREKKETHHHNNQTQEHVIVENTYHKQSSSSPTTPRACSKLGLFSSISNPSTPRLRVRTAVPDNQPPSTTTTSTSTSTVGPSPKLHCNTTKSPRAKFGSNPSSPRSPFAILKNTLRLTKNSCGVCMQSVKTGQGMAIYTAECSHAFHFPCIASHVRKQGCLICPVCNVTWKDVPLLAFHKDNPVESEEIIEKNTITTSALASSAPATPTGANRMHFVDKRVQSVKTKSYERRAYNDDEPLLSPRFNPIPEAEETEECDEFQGFFTTPRAKPPIDPYNSVDKKAPRNVEVRLLPEAAVVSGSRSYETYAVALRVKAPPASDRMLSSKHRAPIDLVTVLDVSGSMTGAKLQMLKRAMRLVISSLGSADRLSIVAFASAPQRLLPLRRMTAQGQKGARKIIDQLACGQGTSVGEALKKAAKVLEDRREKNPVASIILLSDGQDEYAYNGGNKTSSDQRQEGSHVSSARFAHIEIPVHPSGFGFRTPEPEQDAFAKCVGGLLSVVVQDMRVQLGFNSGSAPAEIMAVYSCNGRPALMSSDSARLGDLYAEEEREVLIELKVPTSAIGAHHVMCVRCSYKDPVTQEVMYGRERALLVPRPHAVRSAEPRVDRLKNLFIYTRAVAESRRLVDHGDYTSAHHLLSSARTLVMQSANGSASASASASAEEYAKGLEAELANVHWRRQYQLQKEQEAMVVQQMKRAVGDKDLVNMVDENGEPLTPTSAWRAAERLAKVAIMKKSFNRSVSDLHGFENARF